MWHMPYEMKENMDNKHVFHFLTWGKRFYEKIGVEIQARGRGENTEAAIIKMKEVVKEQTIKYLEESERE
jgi:hypothetical protein